MSISKGTPLSSQIVWFEQRLKEMEAERDSATLAERKAVLDVLWNYAGRKDLSDDDESLLKHLNMLICARSKV